MRRLLIAAVVLALLAVVVDRVAEYVAAGEVASRIEQEEALAAEPEVDFVGFPFLTQVLDGSFEGVRVELASVDAGAGRDSSLRVESVEATFHDVTTYDRFSRATARSLTGTATIPYASVDELTGATTSYGGTNDDGDGLLVLQSSESSDLSIEVGVALLDGGNVGFVGPNSTTRLPVVPPEFGGRVAGMLGVGHPMSGLPSSFTVESVEVTADGIELELSGEDLSLAG